MRVRLRRAFAVSLAALSGLAANPISAAADPIPVGGASFDQGSSADAPEEAILLPDGRAQAPSAAPMAVRRAIAAANRIIGKPYLYGGGHRRFRDRGYDCSGTVSYALRGASALTRPLDSTGLSRWGEPGPGQWITVFTNPGHAYVVIAGLRLDTSAEDDPGGAEGPRWRPLRRSDRGYVRRHPARL